LQLKSINRHIIILSLYIGFEAVPALFDALFDGGLGNPNNAIEKMQML
jgi:hypothetical protein